MLNFVSFEISRNIKFLNIEYNHFIIWENLQVHTHILKIHNKKIR